MASGERFGTIFDGGTMLGLGPAELLDRFRANRDEAAFAALVARHGPMVLATCRRILPVGADADDAFQATFLVLARKASSIADPDRLAPWLHGVARRVALRSRSLAARRRAVEGERPESEEAEAEAVAVPPPPDDLFDLRRVLDEELARLPEKYRTPLVLCYLEGLTHDEAAGQLRCPVGTVRSRLAGGRDRLRSRLVRRGYAPQSSLPVLLATSAPSSLIRATVRVATGAGVVPSHLLLIAQGASIAMILTNPKTWIVAAGFLLSLAAGSAVVVARQDRGESTPQAGPVAQTPAVPPPDPPPSRPAPRSLPANYPITVTGRALDSAGKPIAGARIYLASCSNDDNRRLAETRTDERGSYKFDGVLLSIRPDEFIDPNRPARGFFEVFGQADGFGFAWRPKKQFALPDPRQVPDAPVDPPDSYQPGDPITLDLTFPPPARLTGRVTKDQGRPLVDAPLWISFCDQLSADGPRAGTEFAALGASDTVPREMMRCTTDANGNFAFNGLPPERRFGVVVQPKGFPQRRILAATMPRPQPAHQGQDVLTGPLDLVFDTPREVPFRVVGDTSQPTAKARFGVSRIGGGILWASATTDGEGRGQLLIPPGDYSYEILPEYQTPYLVTEGKFAVPADGPIPPLEATLRPACVLEVTVTDADTGAGLAGVDFWEGEPANPEHPTSDFRQLLYFRSYELATRICHVERPKTDAAGKLKALIEPGPHRIGVGLNSRPPWYDVVEPEGQAIDGKPGETLHLTFPMRRRR